jgi:Domain of unknown function (DUF6438)
VDFKVTLERGVCFGACPAYSVTISGDGKVVYEGISFVDIVGAQQATIQADKVAVLLDRIESVDFFALDDEYLASATDLPSKTISLTMNGLTKQVLHYGGDCDADFDPAPPEICEIENLIDEVAGTQQWVSGGG